MTLAPLVVGCPRCGSTDVVYSCNPSCCFNHVCNRCYTTFEPVTTKVGELKTDPGSVPENSDPTAPTAACARCGECKVFTIVDHGAPSPQLVCVCCNALLTLALTEIVPG